MLFAIVFTIFVIILWWVFTRKQENPLDKLPGPPGIPFFGNAFQVMNLAPEDFVTTFTKYTEQYGDRYVVKIMRWWLLNINNPADMEIILSNTKNISKSMEYSFLKPWLRSGLLLSTGKKWQTRRKIITPTFHFNILKNFHEVMMEKSRNLVKTLKERSGEDINLLPTISEMTLYAICETAMGTQLEAEKHVATVEYKNALIEIEHLLLKRMYTFWYQSDFIFKRSKLGKHFEKSLKTLDTFAENVIAKRKKEFTMKKEEENEDGTKKRKALLDVLLEAELKGLIDSEGVMAEVNTFMFAGHDTTAVALTYNLMLLADYEEIQEKVYEECKELYERCGDKPAMSDLSEMKYMEAVIKESLRLYPSAPFVGRVVDEEFMLGDLWVKKDTNLLLNMYSLHRRKDLYSDPEVFRPERFFNNEMKHPYGFLPFSAGLRNCIGQKFAMLEIKTVLYELLLNFKVVPKIKGWRPTLAVSIIMKPVQPVNVKFIPRD